MSATQPTVQHEPSADDLDGNEHADESPEELEAWRQQCRIRRDVEIADVTAQLQSYYDDGVPFFTKSAIRALAAQLPGKAGDTVRLVGLDGKVVEQKLYNPQWDGHRLAGRHLRRAVSYRTLEHLTHWRHPELFDRATALCPLSVAHYETSPIPDAAEEAAEASADDIDRILAEQTVEWRASEACATLLATLDGGRMPRLPPDVNKVIAFALGGLYDLPQGDSPEAQSHMSRVWQHVLVGTVRDWVLAQQQLAKNGDDDDEKPTLEIKCYAQDPDYSPADKEALARHGIEVIEDPEGFLLVDDQSVVISFSPNVAVKQVVTDLARPAMMVWNTVFSAEEEMRRSRERRAWERENLPDACDGEMEIAGLETNEEFPISLTDPDGPRLRRMCDEEYESFLFPETPEGQLEYVSVYVRKARHSEAVSAVG